MIPDLELCPDPIFVIGSPRSGTTALGWSLECHSEVWTSGEAYVLSDIVTPRAIDRIWQISEVLGEGSWLVREGVARDELLRFLGIGVNALYTSRSEGKRWLDHTTSNTLVVETIADMFPGALFVHILRDGRKAVNSMINFEGGQPEQQRRNFAQIGWTIPWLEFRVACQTWREHVETASLFTDRDPERSLTVIHDELVADPEEGFRRMFDFLRLPYEEQPITKFLKHGVNSSFRPSPADGEGPRSAFPNPWGEWSAEQRQIFLEEAGETFERLGLGELEPVAGAP